MGTEPEDAFVVELLNGLGDGTEDSLDRSFGDLLAGADGRRTDRLPPAGTANSTPQGSGVKASSSMYTALKAGDLDANRLASFVESYRVKQAEELKQIMKRRGVESRPSNGNKYVVDPPARPSSERKLSESPGPTSRRVAWDDDISSGMGGYQSDAERQLDEEFEEALRRSSSLLNGGGNKKEYGCPSTTTAHIQGSNRNTRRKTYSSSGSDNDETHIHGNGISNGAESRPHISTRRITTVNAATQSPERSPRRRQRIRRDSKSKQEVEDKWWEHDDSDKGESHVPAVPPATGRIRDLDDRKVDGPRPLSGCGRCQNGTASQTPSYALPTKQSRAKGDAADGRTEEELEDTVEQLKRERQAFADEAKRLRLRLEGQRRTIHELDHVVAKLKEEAKQKAAESAAASKRASAMTNPNTAGISGLCSCCRKQQQPQKGSHQATENGDESGTAMATINTLKKKIATAESRAQELERCLMECRSQERRAREICSTLRKSLNAATDRANTAEAEVEALSLSLSQAKRFGAEQRREAKAAVKLARRWVGRGGELEKEWETVREEAAQAVRHASRAEAERDAGRLRLLSLERQITRLEGELAGARAALNEQQEERLASHFMLPASNPSSPPRRKDRDTQTPHKNTVHTPSPQLSPEQARRRRRQKAQDTHNTHIHTHVDKHIHTHVDKHVDTHVDRYVDTGEHKEKSSAKLLKRPLPSWKPPPSPSTINGTLEVGTSSEEVELEDTHSSSMDENTYSNTHVKRSSQTHTQRRERRDSPQYHKDEEGYRETSTRDIDVSKSTQDSSYVLGPNSEVHDLDQLQTSPAAFSASPGGSSSISERYKTLQSLYRRVYKR